MTKETIALNWDKVKPLIEEKMPPMKGQKAVFTVCPDDEQTKDNVLYIKTHWEGSTTTTIGLKIKETNEKFAEVDDKETAFAEHFVEVINEHHTNHPGFNRLEDGSFEVSPLGSLMGRLGVEI